MNFLEIAVKIEHGKTSLHSSNLITRLEITAGQRTLSGQKWLLTEQTFRRPDILSVQITRCLGRALYNRFHMTFAKIFNISFSFVRKSSQPLCNFPKFIIYSQTDLPKFFDKSEIGCKRKLILYKFNRICVTGLPTEITILLRLRITLPFTKTCNNK